MADNKPGGKKKPTLGATVPPPNEKADFFAQLQNTFERGVVTAEIDLSGLINEKGGGGSVQTMWGEADRISTGPAGVHDQVIKKMKTIANTFGGSFNVHAPLQANPSDLMSVGRAKSADMIKQSMEYTQKLGGKNLTVHPIGQMEYYFVDPFVGTKIPLPNPFYLAGSEKELKGLMEKLNVRDPLLRSQIEKEWKNFVHTIPMTFAEKFGALAVQDLNTFSQSVGEWKAGELLKKHKGNPERLVKEMASLGGGLHDNIQPVLRGLVEEGMKNPNLAETLIRGAPANELKARRLWPKVAMASLDPIDDEGGVVRPTGRLDELIKKGQTNKLSKGERNEATKLWRKMIKEQEKVRIKAWHEVVAGAGRTRFGPFEDSEEQMVDAVKDTFKTIFSSIKNEKGDLYKALKNKKMQIGLENLFPAAPDRGYMQGYAYFYKPEHMAKLIKAVQKIAQEQGFSKDIVGMTFDTAHAAAAGMKPSDFLKELKKKGIEPKYAHLVGGPGYGHGHIAWGDWLDEVSKMDPEIVERLANVGVINIEGGAGIYDVEVTVNALWNKGVPLEAMLAMAGAPDATPQFGAYWSKNVTPYMQDAAGSYAGTQMPIRNFYSFQNEMTPMPMQSAFGSYSVPAFVGGGYSMGPGRTSSFWSSSQPLLYSSKNKE